MYVVVASLSSHADILMEEQQTIKKLEHSVLLQENSVRKLNRLKNIYKKTGDINNYTKYLKKHHDAYDKLMNQKLLLSELKFSYEREKEYLKFKKSILNLNSDENLEIASKLLSKISLKKIEIKKVNNKFIIFMNGNTYRDKLNLNQLEMQYKYFMCLYNPIYLKKTQDIIISTSINSYKGPCPCPYSFASDGSQCGKRSAYSRPGGEKVFCYRKDFRFDIDACMEFADQYQELN
jgi:hypothetical protein